MTKHRATGVLIGLFLAVILLFLAQGQASAQRLPPHLVGLARSLLTEIDDSDFETYGDSPLKAEVLSALRQSRLQSWQGTNPAVTADMKALAAPLGLDPANPEQRAALDAVLATSDSKARTKAIAAALKLAGRSITSDSLKTARAGVERVIRKATADFATSTKIDLEDGRSIGIEWDPVSGDVEVSIDHGDGRGETVLHGGASGSIDKDGKLSWKTKADAEPVTYLSPEFEADLAEMIFGVWKDGDTTWLIRPPDATEPGREVAPISKKVAEIAELRQRIAELRAKKVYVWRAPDGGRVIQDKYKDLRSLGDYEYLRGESLDYYMEEIAALTTRLAELQGAVGGRNWFAENDPLGIARADRLGRKRQPISVSVIYASGYRFDYDRAAFDGKRVTAERTMRDVPEFNQILPRSVIDELIRSWSPPKWLELRTVYNVRSRTVSLAGKWWALRVRYSPTTGDVSSIRTPYSKPVTLTWEGGAEDDEQAVVLNLKTLDGNTTKTITHNQPFVIEAEYLTPRDIPGEVTIKPEIAAAATDQPPTAEAQPLKVVLWPVYGEGGAASLYRFRSKPLYLRSRQFTERPLGRGLYTDQRYVPEAGLKAAIGEWQRGTKASDPLIAKVFSGEWAITQIDADKAIVGRALVAADGRSARLSLTQDDGFRRYKSLEIRAIPGGEQVEIRFQRVLAFDEEPVKSAGLKPLLQGRIIDVPTLTRQVTFELESGRLVATAAMEPAPEEVIRVLLNKRGKDRWAGLFRTETASGPARPSGQQTWGRTPKIEGAIVVEDQTRRDDPTLAFYPFERPDREAVRKAMQTEDPTERGRRLRLEKQVLPRGGYSKKRHIFVYGQNLPVSSGVGVVIESGTEGITYDYRLIGRADSDRVATGWQKARDQDENFTSPDDYDALMLIATYDDTVKPGIHEVTINGIRTRWFLTFADATARMYFVDRPPLEGVATDLAQAGDIIWLELELQADLPIEEELIFRLQSRSGAAGTAPVDLPVHRATLADMGDNVTALKRLIYRSPPIHVVRAGAKATRPPDDLNAIVIELGGRGESAPENGGTTVATAEKPLDLGPASRISEAAASRYASEPGRLGTVYATWERPDLLRIARPAAVQILDTPLYGDTAWTRAVARARACYEGGGAKTVNSNVDEISRFIITEVISPTGTPNWRNLERAARRLAAPESVGEAIQYADQPGFSLLYEAGKRSGNITLGDHAAALLVRDEFLEVSEQRRKFYLGLAERFDTDFLERGLKYGPDSDAFWKAARARIPGTGLEVNSINNVTGTAVVETRIVGVPIGDLLDFGLSEQTWPEAEKIGGRAFLEKWAPLAAADYAAAINASRKVTIAAGDCDIEHLMVVSTQNAPAIINAILPRLIRPTSQGDRTWWGPDNAARKRVGDLGNLREATQALDAYASLDKTVAAMTVAAATGGTALALSQVGALATAAYVTLAADVLDIAVFGSLGAYEYFEKYGDVSYARGASAALGIGIYDEALAGEPSAFWTAAGVLLPGLGVMGSLGDLRHLRQIERGREIAQDIKKLDKAALQALSAEDSSAFMVYARTMNDLRKVMDATGLAGDAGRWFRLNRIDLSAADRSFLKRYDSFTAAHRAVIERGYDIARMLDDMTGAEVSSLTAAQRSDLTAFLEDIQTRLKALETGKVEGRQAAVSAREARLAEKLGPDMARLNAEAAKLEAARAVRAAEEAAQPPGRPVDTSGKRPSGLDEPGGPARAQDPGDPDGPARAQDPGGPDGPARAQDPGDPDGPVRAQDPGNPDGPARAQDPDLLTVQSDSVTQAIRDRGYNALNTLTPEEVAALRRVANRVAKKLKSGDRGALNEAEQAYVRLADDLAAGARDADRAWRNTPQPEILPPRNTMPPSERARAIRQRLDEVTRRAEEAEFRKALSQISPEPSVAAAAARVELEDSAATLGFRREVLKQLHEAVGDVKKSDNLRASLEGKIAGVKSEIAKLNPDDPASAARRSNLEGEITGYQRQIADLAEDSGPQRAMLERTTERDLEWLSGTRAKMRLDEIAEAEAVLKRNKSQWKKMLKDKSLSPGQLQQMSEYRKAVVDGMLNEIINEVRREGQQIDRLAFGSNNLTSDYDLSIKVAGGEAGAAEVVRRFNNRFRDRFGGEAGLVFDTNVYTEPAYTFFSPSGRGAGKRGISPVQQDAIRQNIYRETAARRYMSDGEWQANKAGMLAGATEDEATALNHIFDQVEKNFENMTRAERAQQAKLAGGEARLQGMEARYAKLAEASRGGRLTPEEAAELGKLESKLEQFALQAANQTYADALTSVERYATEYNRLAAIDLDDPAALSRLQAVTPDLARTSPGSKKLGAYGRKLEALKNDLARAKALKSAGKDPSDALRAARTRQVEMLEELGEQVRNRQGQALFYASEAYQTDGAIAHVVGELQEGGRRITAKSLRQPPVKSKLTADQYFDSFGENRANMFKEVGGARNRVTGAFDYPSKAAAKAAKYMIRQLDAAHQGGINLGGLRDQRIIDLTTTIDANRKDLDAVARVLRKQGLSAEEYVRMAEEASNALSRQTFKQGALRRNAAAIADYVRVTEEDVANALLGPLVDPELVELRRPSETIRRNARAQAVLNRLDEGSLRGLDDLATDDAHDFTRAVQDARTRVARGGSDQLNPTEARLIETADRLTEEARAADTAWREAPAPDRLPRDIVLSPGQGAKEVRKALQEVRARLSQARIRAQMAGEGSDAARAARAQFLDTANDLDFRQKVLSDIARQIDAENAATAKVGEARRALAKARADGSSAGDIARANEALGEAVIARRTRFNRARPVTPRDIEWLSGARRSLTPEEVTGIKSALARNDNQWQKMLKDKTIGPAQLQRMTVWRKQVIDAMLDGIIADEVARTGLRPERLAFGSNNLTSDYDLSIKVDSGPGSARVVRRFNKAFRDRFGAESGVVFDTNVYTEPSYRWISAADTTRRGRVPVHAREADRVGQAIYRETKIRRFASEAQWQRHRALTLDGLSSTERRAFEFVLEQAEDNVAAAKDAISDGVARAAADRGEVLADLQARRAAAIEAGDTATTAAIDAKLENYALEAANERYADILEEIDDSMRALQRLQDLNAGEGPVAIGSVATGLPSMPKAARDALRADLSEAADLVSEARRLEASGAPGAQATALLKRAEAEVVLDQAASRLAKSARDRQGEALYYASEAYFTEGAIKHVVGELQAGGRKITVDSLTRPPVASTITKGEYLDSFYENRGDMLKELGHLRGPDGTFNQPAKAAAKVSKYLIRQLDAAHQGGLDLSRLPDQRLIAATVAVNQVRGDFAKVEKVLEELGMTPESFAELAIAGSDALTGQAVRASLVRATASDIAETFRPPRAELIGEGLPEGAVSP